MIEISRQHEFLVGIDSDGCAFDTMEIKHKECFIPHFIEHYGLQGVSKYAREAFEFVNLYSKSRGINRFPALLESLEWLQKRPEVQARGVEIRIPAGLAEWVRHETRLANATLAAAVDAGGDADLRQALAWSNAVNQSIGRIVHGVPPFPYVRQSLEKLVARVDLLVVSATPQEALAREWQEHDLAKYVQAICGQEDGTKQELLKGAHQYKPQQALMIGDAPGDYKAALANEVLFFPINPGAEQASWQRFYEEGSERFLSGRFAGDYQRQLLDEFNSHLPALPPWLKA